MEFFEDLRLLFQAQSHRTLVLWAFDFASETIDILKGKYPEEMRLEESLSAARAWASGKIKMREAQRRILDCHAFAKEISDRSDIAMVHAVAQACSVVHTSGHAIGYPVYDLTAIVFEYGLEACIDIVEKRKMEYMNRVFYWADHLSDTEREWADFMLR